MQAGIVCQSEPAFPIEQTVTDLSSFAWDTSTKGGSCNPPHILADIYYADTAVNIVTDWFCALLYGLSCHLTICLSLTFHTRPIPLLWNIQLNKNAKVSVAFLLSMGVLASISACIRLKYTVNLVTSKEYLHDVSDIVIWGCKYLSPYTYTQSTPGSLTQIPHQMPRTA